MDHVLKFLEEEKVIDDAATWETIPFYKPVKSADAEDGFKGRVGIHEVIKSKCRYSRAYYSRKDRAGN